MTHEFLDDFEVVRKVKACHATWIFTTTTLLQEVYVKPTRNQALGRTLFKNSIGYEVHLGTTDQKKMCEYVKGSCNGSDDYVEGC